MQQNHLLGQNSQNKLRNCQKKLATQRSIFFHQKYLEMKSLSEKQHILQWPEQLNVPWFSSRYPQVSLITVRFFVWD